MSQFTVYKNRSTRSKGTYPLLLDVQANVLADLETRVVIPLTRTPALSRKPIGTLTPVVEVDGEKYLLMTPQLAGISKGELGASVAQITEQRAAVIGALDLLVTGV